MKRLSAFLSWNMLAGALLVALLQACANVSVGCPDGGLPPPNGGTPGGCNTLYPYSGDAFNFYNVESRAIITDHTHMCASASSKCQTNAGKCGFGAPPCKSYFMPDSAGSMTGSCSCGCG